MALVMKQENVWSYFIC